MNKKRLWATALATALTFSLTTPVNVMAADSLNMPITLLDHQNDGLLFEYDLSNEIISKLTINNNGLENGKSNIQGLSIYNTPLYTQETIDEVADIIYNYFLSNSDSLKNYMATNDSSKGKLRQIYNQILENEDSLDTTHLWKEIQKAKDPEPSEIGWSYDGLTFNSDEKAWYDGDTKVWYKEGDHLKSATQTNHTLSYTYKDLAAGTYQLNAYQGGVSKNVKVTLTVDGESKEFNVEDLAWGYNPGNNDCIFTLDGAKDVTITIEATADDADIAALRLVNTSGNVVSGNNDTDGTLANGLVMKAPETKLGELSIDGVSEVTATSDYWKVANYDWSGTRHTAITPAKANNTDSTYNDALGNAYANVKLNSVKNSTDYKLSFFNENNLCSVKVYDDNGNEIESTLTEGFGYNGDGDKVYNGYNTLTFNSGTNGVNVRIYQDDSKKDTSGYRKVQDLDIQELPIVSKGSFNESLKKYGDYGYNTGATGKTDKKLADVNTCYDYAYYVVNNFWNDTNGDITSVDNSYDYMALKNVGNDQYTITSTKDINYDTGSKIISQGSDEVDNGFFPVDNKNTFGDSKLKGDYPTESESKEEHNFHYAMKSNISFKFEGKPLNFDFSGDDDVYVFINDKLALDLGGAHTVSAASLDIDENGKVYVTYGTLSDEDKEAGKTLKKVDTGITITDEFNTLNFFYMERHTTASNLTISTNMYFKTASADTEVSYYDNEHNKVNTVDVGKDVNVEYSVTAGGDDMKNVTFTDKGLGVELTLNEDKVQLTTTPVENIEVTYDDITLTVTDKDGNVVKTITLTKEELENGNSDKIKDLKLDKDQKLTVSGIKAKTTKKTTPIKSDLTTTITGLEDVYDETTGKAEEKRVTKEKSSEATVTPDNDQYGYTVRYVDANGKEIADPTIGEKATYGTDKEVEAKTIKGYTPRKTTDTVNITTDESKNVVTFVYDINQYDYTVKYVDENDRELADSKEVKDITYNTEVKETAKDITGYSVKGDSEQNVVIDEDNKVIKFVYTINKYPYTVRYVDENNKDITEAVTKEGKDYKSLATEDALEFKGYTLNDAITKSTEITTDPTQNEIVFHYTANKYPYTVRYVDEDGKDLLDAKTVEGATYGTDVEENAEKINGYTVDKDSDSITIDTENNEIVFTYVKTKYQADFEFVSENGKELPEEVKNLLPQTKTGLVMGDEVTADLMSEVRVKGGKWVFVGWNEDTQTVDEENLQFIGTWRFVADAKTPTTNNNNNSANGNTTTTTNGNTYGKVDTGDTTNIFGYIVLLISSAFVALFTRKNKEER